MIQGCGSNVGKSLLVAGLVRAAKKRGMSVAPFKPQNMSNNAAITVDGGEAGRAQSFQAYAAGIDFHSDMNPVLLKPENTIGSQVILNGKKYKSLKAREYYSHKDEFLAVAIKSFRNLLNKFDIVIAEGAGSLAEVNLRKSDIANMGFATALSVPVIVVADIERGGVIAQLIGTKAVLDKKDINLIEGFIINKFRGDQSLFDDGVTFINNKTDWKSFGVMPFFDKAKLFPAEDSQDLKNSFGTGKCVISVLKLSRIANFDDFDPLKIDKRLKLRFVEPGNPIPADTKLIIIPGTKSTIADLNFLKSQGWDIDIRAHLRRGGFILGICGGYQILGNEITDGQGYDGIPSNAKGLGLLDVQTTMGKEKNLGRKEFISTINGKKISGYEIHLGITSGSDCNKPFATLSERKDGAISSNGLVMGTYLHGLFFSDEFRNKFVAKISSEEKEEDVSFNDKIDFILEEFVNVLEDNLDVDSILSSARNI